MPAKSILAKIKAFFTPEFEPSDKLNANNSRYLAFAQIAFLVVGFFIPSFGHQHGVYGLGFYITELLLLVATGITAVGIGFHNTFETNDDYKTGVQVVSGIANIIVPCIFLTSYASIIR